MSSFVFTSSAPCTQRFSRLWFINLPFTMKITNDTKGSDIGEAKLHLLRPAIRKFLYPPPVFRLPCVPTSFRPAKMRGRTKESGVHSSFLRALRVLRGKHSATLPTTRV